MPAPFNAFFKGVAVVRGGGAWAVGTKIPAGPSPSTAFIERWNGHAWRRSPIGTPGGTGAASTLAGVVAPAADLAFAVGAVDLGGVVTQTLIERWNGASWKRQASPNPGGDPGVSSLDAVAAASPSSAWAVGSYLTCSFCVPMFNQTLIEHWNGHAWRQVASPSPGPADSFLFGVSALSANDAWAVGATTDSAGFEQTLIEHWNGHAWRQVRSPNPGGPNRSNALFGVTAISRSDIWAVGTAVEGKTDDTLIERWNGTTWKQVRSPQGPAGNSGSFLYAVADGWAVGTYAKNGADQTLIERWNGVSWRRVTSPDPGGAAHPNLLTAVAARSASSAWATGYFATATAPDRPLSERWNGRSWTTVPNVHLSLAAVP